MEILVERRWKKAGYTIGLLSVDGKALCNTLEDTDRGLTNKMSPGEVSRKKVYGETAIPTGRYKVVESYSGRFGKMMPEIVRVPGFSGIRIHSGNSANDTDGCILVGKNDVVGRVTNSRYWYNILFSKIHAAIFNGYKVWITIK